MIGKYMVGGRFDPPFHPAKTSAQFIGRMIDIPVRSDDNRIVSDTFHLSHDIEFYAISVRVNTIRAEDFWNLTVNEKQIAKTIYCKDFEEGLYFQVAHPVAAGAELQFDFCTSSGEAKKIQVMFHFLSDPDIELEVIDTIF